MLWVTVENGYEWPLSHEMESREVQHRIGGAKFGFCDSRLFVGTRFEFPIQGGPPVKKGWT